MEHDFWSPRCWGVSFLWEEETGCGVFCCGGGRKGLPAIEMLWGDRGQDTLLDQLWSPALSPLLHGPTSGLPGQSLDSPGLAEIPSSVAARRSHPRYLGFPPPAHGLPSARFPWGRVARTHPAIPAVPSHPTLLHGRTSSLSSAFGGSDLALH